MKIIKFNKIRKNQNFQKIFITMKTMSLNKTKSIYNVLITSLFSILLIAACEDSIELDSEATNNINKFESYKVVGEYHNSNLDYIYSNIEKKIHKMNLTSRLDNKKVQKFLTNEFIAQKVSEFSAEKKILDISQYKENIGKACLRVTSLYYPIISSSKMNDNNSSNFNLDLDNYNRYQKIYLNMILNNDKSDVKSFQAEIENIIKEMENDVNLKTDERDIIYLAGAIAFASFEYWDKNTSKWESLLSTTQQNNCKYGNYKVDSSTKFDWDSMWRSDVEGGIGGGIGGAIAGGSVSLGVLTVPGWVAGAVGGAVGTSAGNAVGQWLFD